MRCVIRNGLVITPNGRYPWDVVCEDEHIVALQAQYQLRGFAELTRNAFALIFENLPDALRFRFSSLGEQFLRVWAGRVRTQVLTKCRHALVKFAEDNISAVAAQHLRLRHGRQ